MGPVHLGGGGGGGGGDILLLILPESRIHARIPVSPRHSSLARMPKIVYSSIQYSGRGS